MKEKRPGATAKPRTGTSHVKKSPPTNSDKGLALPPPSDLFAAVSGLIEEARRALARQMNSTTVFLFWRIGQQVNS